jgi:transposase
MREIYDSDISREQFQRIEALLDSARKKTKPREVDLYEVFCALLYLLRTGCQWRMLPKEYPKWTTVYAYYAKWRHRPQQDQPSLLEQALKKSGWRGPGEVGAARKDDLSDR